MSDILIAILRMPPECWRDDPIDIQQRYSRYLEAAERIQELDQSIQTTEDRAQERSEREEREEKARFEKAKKITMAEYDGSQFFYSDYYPTDPKYVWATKPEPVLKKRDTYGIFKNDLVDAGWVEICWEDVKGVEELDAALAKFCQANEKFRVFYPDYSTAILIEDEVAEYLRDIDHD
jgi:hypothetical protein